MQPLKLSFTVPFDDNYVRLSDALFSSPAISYVNASRILFPGQGPAFIASQAPKPASFNHFWHMVIQEKVNIDIEHDQECSNDIAEKTTIMFFFR